MSVSRYRIVLESESRRKVFGSLLSERVLLQALEQHGTVWSLVVNKDGLSAWATFRSAEVVEKLIAIGQLEVKGTKLAVTAQRIQPGTPVRAHPSACMLAACEGRQRARRCIPEAGAACLTPRPA